MQLGLGLQDVLYMTLLYNASESKTSAFYVSPEDDAKVAKFVRSTLPNIAWYGQDVCCSR